ncbi:MAG TPA: hypothetical protein VJP58_09070 [Candidatus Nitrosocosmicus sp.]|nr:hypothetical protein [Candidatus Nitrosocosmicus sp.]
MKSVDYDNHGKNENSVKEFKTNIRSDENTHEDMTNIEENSILDFNTLCNLRQGRLEDVLSERYEYNTSVERGQRFLLAIHFIYFTIFFFLLLIYDNAIQ